MISEKFITFGKPDLGEEEMSSVMDVIRSGWVGTGKVSHQFEEEFSEFVGGGYSVAVSSCSMGLILALKAAGIKKGDGVIVPAMTFAATLNAVLAVGADPILVDIDNTGNLDINKVNKRLDYSIKAVIPVHMAGRPCNLTKLDKNVKVIEDCAHAFGSLLGNRGDFKVFSFYANKNITCGEGGMVICKSKEDADKVRILSSQGLSNGAWSRYGNGALKEYSVEEVGFKGNLPDILASIGLVQLRRWPEMRKKRAKVFNIYKEVFGTADKEIGHSMHFYPILLEVKRDEIRKSLWDKGIGTGIHYKPLHLEPAYEFLGYKQGDFKKSEFWGRCELSLSISATMTEYDAVKVIETLEKEMKIKLFKDR